jgi:hypothetical protein
MYSLPKPHQRHNHGIEKEKRHIPKSKEQERERERVADLQMAINLRKMESELQDQRKLKPMCAGVG